MSSRTHLFGHLYDVIRSADRVLLVAHKKPDGDTLGSSSSMLNWLLRDGKEVTAFCPDLPSAEFRFIDNIHCYTNDPTIFERPYDVVIIFDAGDLRYCGVDQFIPRLPPGYVLVNIDHHVTNELFAHLNLVFTDASSTAEVVHRFYEENHVFVDARMATSLFTGIFTDTSSFSNAATRHATVAAASQMLAQGARLCDIHTHLLRDKSVQTLRLWGLLLSRLRHHERYDVVSTYLRQEDMGGASQAAIEGVGNFLNALTHGTDTILVLQETSHGMVKGSFRSVSRDISTLARLMGGGGHTKAAGFAVNGRIEETTAGPRIIPTASFADRVS